MFGIGLPELFIILVIALVVLGPDKLPGLAKAIGKGIGEFRRATDEIKESFQADDDLRKIQNSLSQAKNDMSQFVREETQNLDTQDLVKNIEDGTFFDADAAQNEDETETDSQTDSDQPTEDSADMTADDQPAADPVNEHTESDSNR